MGQAEMLQAGPARFLHIPGVVFGVPQFGRYKHLLTTEKLGGGTVHKNAPSRVSSESKPPFSTSSSPSRLRASEPWPLPPPARRRTQPHSRYAGNRSLKLPAPPASPDDAQTHTRSTPVLKHSGPGTKARAHTCPGVLFQVPSPTVGILWPVMKGLMLRC